MIRWTERSFSFDFPVTMMPIFLERLRGTNPRLRDFVKNLSPEILLRKNGIKWNFQEHIGHLLDLDELHDGRLDDFKSGLPVLRAADMKNLKTESAHHDNWKIEELLNEFEKSRNSFIDRLSNVPPELTSFHPRLQKPMRVVDMAFFVCEHDDHHIALMRELYHSNFISQKRKV